MRAATVERWIWILVYGGLVLVALGVSVWRADAALAVALCSVGSVAIGAGIVLVWLRSRLKDET